MVNLGALPGGWESNRKPDVFRRGVGLRASAFTDRGVSSALLLLLLVGLGGACDDRKDVDTPFNGPGAPTADDDFEYIIEPGNEARFQAAIEPFRLQGEVGDGYVLAGIAIARGMVTYRLAKASEGAAWVTLAVYHGGDGAADPTDGLPNDTHLQYTVAHGEAIPLARAVAIARPLVDRLSARAAALSEVWTPRVGSGTAPARVGARNAPAPSDEADLDEPDPLAEDSEASQILTADNILVGVGVLLLVLILASGLPAFLRKKNPKK